MCTPASVHTARRWPATSSDTATTRPGSVGSSIGSHTADPLPGSRPSFSRTGLAGHLRRQSPHADGVAAGDDCLAGRVEGDAEDRLLVPGETLHLPPGRHLPQPHGAVL